MKMLLIALAIALICISLLTYILPAKSSDSTLEIPFIGLKASLANMPILFFCAGIFLIWLAVSGSALDKEQKPGPVPAVGTVTDTAGPRVPPPPPGPQPEEPAIPDPKDKPYELLVPLTERGDWPVYIVSCLTSKDRRDRYVNTIRNVGFSKIEIDSHDYDGDETSLFEKSTIVYYNAVGEKNARGLSLILNNNHRDANFDTRLGNGNVDMRDGTNKLIVQIIGGDCQKN